MENASYPRLSDAVLPPQLAALTVNVAAELGGSKQDLFEPLGFDEASLYEEGRLLQFSEMYELIEQAMSVSSAPWLGLEVGRAETVNTWGVLGYALMSCATERKALEIGAEYYAAAPSLMKTSSIVEDGMLRVQMDPLHDVPHLLPFCVEENMSGICAVSSSYLIEPFRPTEIWLTYAAPEHAARYEEVFECPIRFEQSANIMWAREPTNRPLKTSDPIMAQACLKMVQDVIAQHRGEPDFVHRMREILLEKPGEIPDLNEASARLSMSARTLRRRLTELGTSFKQLTKEVRRDLAIDYLQSTPLNIDQISHLLGYTETTNFRRAFKAWTGKPPSAFR